MLDISNCRVILIINQSNLTVWAGNRRNLVYVEIYFSNKSEEILANNYNNKFSLIVKPSNCEVLQTDELNKFTSIKTKKTGNLNLPLYQNLTDNCLLFFLTFNKKTERIDGIPT